jgi:hypothetical protein
MASRVTLGPFPYGDIQSVSPSEIDVSSPFIGISSNGTNTGISTADGQSDIQVTFASGTTQTFNGGSYKVMKIKQMNGSTFSYIPSVMEEAAGNSGNSNACKNGSCAIQGGRRKNRKTRGRGRKARKGKSRRVLRKRRN